MLSENIKKFRTEKGMSQEDLAERVNVVRQTVSKWEKGSSLPDANMLVELSKVFEVSVNELLDIEDENDNSAELERLNGIIEEKDRQAERAKLVSAKREKMICLLLVMLIFTAVSENGIISIIVTVLCVAGMVGILYKNMDMLTGVENTAVLKKSTIIVSIIVGVVMAYAFMGESGIITPTETTEKFFAFALVFAVMVVIGYISPKLPFQRYMGIRLPWTVRDEDTWNMAHRVLGFISLPVAVMYAVCAVTFENFEAVSIAAVLIWVAIPSVMSFIFYRKRYNKN